MGKVTKKILEGCNFKKIDYFLVLILIIIGSIVRIYRINSQSIFFDEYVTVGNFKILDIKNFFYVFFIYAPDLGISPLSTIILYYWLNLFQNFDCIWRLLPITFGMLTIVITYFFAKSIGGRRVAFLACLLFCLSPFNIWFHQELRCYAFLQFFSLSSLYALFKYFYIKQKQWIWFTIGFVSNLILPWFHATYAIYPLFQVIVLILNAKLDRKISLWIIQCIISPLLWGIWYMYLSPFIYNMVNPAHTRAKLLDFVVRIFGNDGVGISAELLPEWKTNNSHLDESLMTNIVENIYFFDWYIVVVFILMFLLFIWDVCSKRNKNHIFLLLIVLIPILTFLLLELLIIKKPIFHPLYFFYVFPLMYIAVAIVITNFKRRTIYLLVVSTLIFSYMIQCMSLILYKNRTDYKCMTKYIEENAGIGDIVLGQRSTSFWDIGKIYQKRRDLQYDSYYTLYQLNKKVENFLEKYERVWITVEPYTLHLIYHEDIIELLTKNFKDSGVDIYWKEFPGQYNLYIGQLTKEKQIKINASDKRLLGNRQFVNYKTLMGELKVICYEEEINRENMELLKEYILMWPLLPWVNIFVIGEFLKIENYIMAERMCDYLIERYPDFSDLYLLKGSLYMYLGDEKMGKEYINKAKCKNVILAKYLCSLFSSNSSNQLNYKKNIYERMEKINHEGIMPLNTAFELLFKVYDKYK